METISQNQLEQKNEMIENFICIICLEIPITPLLCESCQCLVCQRCSNNIEQYDKKCPQKCSQETFKTIKAQKIVLNCIQNIKIKCFQESLGCKKILKLSEINNHAQDDCMYINVNCKYSECDFLDLRKNVVEHQKTCVYRKYKCDQCNGVFQYIEKDSHQCIKYLLDYISQEKEISKHQDILIQQQKEQNYELNEQLETVNNEKSLLTVKYEELQSQLQDVKNRLQQATYKKVEECQYISFMKALKITNCQDCKRNSIEQCDTESSSSIQFSINNKDYFVQTMQEEFNCQKHRSIDFNFKTAKKYIIEHSNLLE